MMVSDRPQLVELAGELASLERAAIRAKDWGRVDGYRRASAIIVAHARSRAPDMRDAREALRNVWRRQRRELAAGPYVTAHLAALAEAVRWLTERLTRR